MLVDGIVLCGGKSSRMGQNKSTLAFGAMSWRQWSAVRLREAGVQQVWFSGHSGSEGIPDQYPHGGPVCAITSCIQARAGHVDGLCIVPVDMPMLSVSSLKHLIGYGVQSGEPCHFSHHPMPLYLPLTPASGLHEQRPDNLINHSLKAWLSSLSARQVAFQGDDTELVNINTPQALKQWKPYLQEEHHVG
ncbi:NTP transferase domain-containing protein [Aestuariibacter halophilus]|uniref:NTP transferase domain-containing protein n=1 Tax=Fluctibacter halophilus TaxID=226011 RepID=A0ABS8G4Q7_9ALTE|nr:NTP transferase domain-containing protein [Aestuariibacter halophilus]MCC2615545.1 NTP transferase domain-containing protein [Aestuariibacter halophilus]